MKIDLFDFNKVIKDKKLEEVTNPVYFNLGVLPTDDGLFSYKIFGSPGSVERKTKFAYMNLKKHFLHPVMYKLLTSMDKKIENCILGNGYYIVNSNGELEENEEKGMNGVTFLYKNFDKLVFKDTGSDERKIKMNLLKKTPKNEIFINKFLIIPAFYRDFNPSKSSNEKIDAVDEINKYYSNVIRMCSSLSENDEIDFMGVNTEASVQQTLNDIYTYLTQTLAGKRGLLHQGLLGKSIDYATRSVISAPRFNTQKWNDNPIRFGYTGVPISQLCVLFFPFYLKYIQDFVELHKADIGQVRKADGSLVNINLQEQFSEEKIKKC